MIVALLIVVAFAAGFAAAVLVIRTRGPQTLPLSSNGAARREARRAAHRRGPAHDRGRARGRILFPFVGGALSERALEACLRLARAEQAELVPAYLVSVPMALNLDAPLPRACGLAFELLEAIEQRAAAAGVPVDARIGRGRTLRHAMRQLMASERFDRIVIPAGDEGFSADDVAWVLRHAEGEVIVLRPADDRLLRARQSDVDFVAAGDLLAA